MKTVQTCTQCGACLNTCPVFKNLKGEEFSPKAKQQLILTALGPHGDELLQWNKVTELAGHCTSCERCKTTCPLKLSVPKALANLRAKRPKWQQFAWKEWIKHGAMLWPSAKHMAPLVPQKILPSKLAILHASALAMQKPPQPQPWLRFKQEQECTQWKGKQVALFAGCTATRLRPQWIEKTKKMLTLLGAHVIENLHFQCCGGTYEHAGMLKASQEATKHTLAQWEKAGRPKLIIFCASCLHSLQQYECSAQQQEAWNTSLTPLSTIIESAHLEKTVHAPENIAYHSPCHWGKKDLDMHMLHKALPQLSKGKSLCCGFGGVLKLLNPTLSEKLANSCWQGLVSSNTNPTKVLTGCSGCVMQLSAHAPKDAIIYHWLDILEISQ